MTLHFTERRAASVRVGMMLLFKNADGTASAYNVCEITMPSDRIRFGFDDDKYRYADKDEMVLVAEPVVS